MKKIEKWRQWWKKRDKQTLVLVRYSKERGGKVKYLKRHLIRRKQRRIGRKWWIKREWMDEKLHYQILLHVRRIWQVSVWVCGECLCRFDANLFCKKTCAGSLYCTVYIFPAVIMLNQSLDLTAAKWTSIENFLHILSFKSCSAEYKKNLCRTWMLNKSSDFFYQKENFMIRTLKSHAPKESEKNCTQSKFNYNRDSVTRFLPPQMFFP